MKSFEQQIAVAVRNLTVVCVILAVALLATIGLSIAGILDAADASRQVGADLRLQTHNRISNVAHWCSSINVLTADLVAYVAEFQHVPPLQLAPLDCAAIEHKTLQSTQSP